MISDRDLVRLERVGERVLLYSLAPMTRASAERYLAIRDAEFLVHAVPSCRCCGSPASTNLRCAKHQDRNPCAVEGCLRTGAAGSAGLADDQTICGTHWRSYVPPASPERRAYHRFWRLAKKQGGWDPRLISRFERYWGGLIARVRRRASGGHLDQAAIERMFGWEAQAA